MLQESREGWQDDACLSGGSDEGLSEVEEEHEILLGQRQGSSLTASTSQVKVEYKSLAKVKLFFSYVFLYLHPCEDCSPKSCNY